MLIASGISFTAAAQAQPFVDDFGDGSVTDGEPVMWGPYIDPWGQGGTAEVVDGDLLLTPDADAPSLPIPWINPNWIEANALTVERRFQDISVHTQARVSGTGQGGFFVTARDTWNDDPVSRGVNVFAGVGVDDNPSIRWLMLGGNTPTGELTTQFLQTSLNMHTSDVHLQLEVFGDMASLYAWEDGQTKPANPLLSRRLPGSLMVDGHVSAAYGQLRPSVHPAGELNTATFRFIEVVPEPSGMLLLVIGGTLCMWSRQNRCCNT